MSETKAMSQESEVTKLEPCPFKTVDDDGEPHVVFIEWNRASVPHYWAECQTCDAHGPWERTREAAIASWNRRAPPADARLREAVIEECAKKIRNDLLWAAPELWESKIARRIADALPHLDGRPISAEARDIIIEECASAIEDAFRSAPNDRASGYRQNTISHGCIEAARVVRALRSSPAASEPSKDEHGDYDNIASMLPSILASGSERCPLCGQQGVHEHTPAEIIIYRNGVKYGRSLAGTGPAPSKGARETPALDEVLGNVHRSSQAGFTELRNRARAELSALKSAAPEWPAPISDESLACALREELHASPIPDADYDWLNVARLARELLGVSERPAMAVEACAREIADRFIWDTDHDRQQVAEILRKHFTPAAASPTVKEE